MTKCWKSRKENNHNIIEKNSQRCSANIEKWLSVWTLVELLWKRKMTFSFALSSTHEKLEKQLSIGSIVEEDSDEILLSVGRLMEKTLQRKTNILKMYSSTHAYHNFDYV